MTNTFFIDVRVPAPDVMTSPYLVFYDNGDWAIEMGGDTHYNSTQFLSQSCVSLFQMFSDEEFDQDYVGVDIYLEIDIDHPLEEPVALIWANGSITSGDRFQAEKLIANDNPKFFNYIPLGDLIDDLEKFVAKKGGALFEDYDDDFQPLDFDDED